MTQYRIEQECGLFTPQEKVLWWWVDIRNLSNQYTGIYLTLEEAIDALDQYTAKPVKYVKKHHPYPVS